MSVFSICECCMSRPKKAISKNLLEILVCPLCRVKVELEEDYLVCVKCLRKYPVKDGIPVMLVEEAKLDEKSKLK